VPVKGRAGDLGEACPAGSRRRSREGIAEGRCTDEADRVPALRDPDLERGF